MANALTEDPRGGHQGRYGAEKKRPNRKVGEWREQKAEGCYRPITVWQLVMSWWAFKEGHINALDLRTYFACHELDERRAAFVAARRANKEGARKDWKPEFTWQEIRTLTGGGGGGESAVRCSLRRLEAVGLLQARKSSIRFATSPDELTVENLETLFEMFRAITNRSRRIHVPRRLVRELAAGFSKAVTATVIAHLINCVYFHRSENAYRVDGRVKASWLASVFGVSERAVVDARHKLEELGFLSIVRGENQQLLNRFGLRVVIHIDWVRGQAVDDRIADPQADSEHRIADPISNRSLFVPQSTNNSTPAEPGPSQAGVSRKQGEGKAAPPRLADIVPADFIDVHRQQTLHAEAVKRGLARDGEPGFLDFAALLERARAHGKKPCALAAHLVWNKRYDYITQADEDAARVRVKEQLYGVTSKREPERERPSKRPVRVELSDDARLVKACLIVSKQKKLYAHPFTLARQMHQWSRERWDVAEAELLDAQNRERLAHLGGGGAEAKPLDFSSMLQRAGIDTRSAR